MHRRSKHHAKLNSTNCWFIQRQIFVNSAIERGYKRRDTKSRRFVARAERWRSSLENFEEIVTSFLEFDSLQKRKRKKKRARSGRTMETRLGINERNGKKFLLIQVIRLRWLIQRREQTEKSMRMGTGQTTQRSNLPDSVGEDARTYAFHLESRGTPS